MQSRNLSWRPALWLAAILSTVSFADEGMWTFDNFPLARVNSQFGTRLDQAWLDRVRLASVRLQNCSASFVSPNGLILTNHHCAEACLAENSSKTESLLDSGFLASDRSRELKCQVQIADVLIAMENITARITAATAGQNATQANEARKRALTDMESACEAASGKARKAGALKCESVALYNGGQYFLYKYRRYSDLRLVFAPERDIAAFGGDPDNFQYPRWCLDMALLRAYDDQGKPVASPNFMPLNFDGPAAGEAVFVTGNPGGTDRLLTVAQYRQLRNLELPGALLRSSELRGRYLQFAKSGPDAQRITEEPINGLENGIKVRRKLLDALHEDSLFATKQAAENALRAEVAARPDLARNFGDPWRDIEQALAVEREFYFENIFLEGAAGFNSRLFRYARLLVRSADERLKPNNERLREYTDSSLARLQQQLGATVPVYPELEELTLSFSLERMREWLGPDHPVVRRLLGKDSPDSLAKQLVAGSQLQDAATRTALYASGADGLKAPNDPMIELARSIDAESRALRKRHEDLVEAPIRIASEKIARARFAVLGTAVYPDATFTPRLNYGSVQAWRENGVDLAPFTPLSRAFERATGAKPFKIPASWLAVRDKLDMNARFNLATNSDIIGGNSGSPLINAKAEVVGLMFDGNIHSIAGDYWFDTAKNRAVAVHPAIMREALAKVYRADSLLAELTGKQAPQSRKR